MGGFIVKQPNGLYARHSTVVDCITDYNMTREEYINMCIKRAVERAKEDAEDTLKRWVQPFRSVIENFRSINMDYDEFGKILIEMGATKEDLDYWKEKKAQLIEDEKYDTLYNETIELIREVYKEHPAGGDLHIVLDDGNVKDHYIQWSIDNLECEDPRERELYIKCANNLLKMEESQREEVIRDAFKYIN